MKIEKLYERLNRYVSTLDSDAQYIVKKLSADPQAPVMDGSLGLLATILRDVRDEIATVNAKSTGRRGVLAAARRVIKIAGEKVNGKCSGAWAGKDGRQYICSGYHGVALNDPLDLPGCEGIEGVEDSILGVNDHTEKHPLPLPSAAQVRAHIKISKAEGRAEGREKLVIWDFGAGFPMVNAQYLLDLLDLLPETEAVYTGETAPLYFHSPAGDGILLPVRPMERPRENTADRYIPPAVPADVPEEATLPATLADDLTTEAACTSQPVETEASPTIETSEITDKQETAEDKTKTPEDPTKREMVEAQTPKAEGSHELKTGDIVEISNAYAKSHNGLYVVTHSPGDPGWLGKDHALRRITKAGKLSTRSDHTHFWPLVTFTTNREYAAKADAWNRENARITPASVKDVSSIAVYFQQQAESNRKYAERYEWDFGKDHPETHQARTLQEFYESVARRLCPEGLPSPVPGNTQEEDVDEIAQQKAEEERIEKEREEARPKVERQIAEGREYIEKIMGQHPIRDGDPVVKICWSEHPAFYSWEDGTLFLSPAAAEIILAHYDEERAAEGKGYDKTKFLITWTNENGEESSYEGRYDLGDQDGGLVSHIRDTATSYRKNRLNLDPQKAEGTANRIDTLADRLQACLATQQGEIISFSWAPWLQTLADERRKEAESTAALMEMLTDDQLEKLFVQTIPNDLNMARFFLQRLFFRDQNRALELWDKWKGKTAS